ncbi:restriction endonuclease subunit S [bacterium]|nr:restriction endonuclease subunit S [bacterium]
MEIPLPPLETQKAIVAKLDQIFAELDQTKLEIQKNLDNTGELWKSALNQAFQGDWEMKKLEEIYDITSSKRVFQKDWRTS